MQATFLKLFVNIRILWFINLDKGLNFKGWEDLVKFLVIVIANLTFDSNPSVIFVLIGVSCSQKAKNSRISDTVHNTKAKNKLTLGMIWIVVDKASKLDFLTFKFIWKIIDNFHEFQVILILDDNA